MISFAVPVGIVIFVFTVCSSRFSQLTYCHHSDETRGAKQLQARVASADGAQMVGLKHSRDQNLFHGTRVARAEAS